MSASGSVAYQGRLVEDVKSLINIMLHYAGTTAHKDFVVRMGQRLCPAHMRPHRVITDHGVGFMGNDVVVDSSQDFIIVDEHFLNGLKGLTFCCEGVLTLGPGLVNETPVQYMLGVLRRAVAQAKRSVTVSYYPRVYLDDILPPKAAADEDETVTREDDSSSSDSDDDEDPGLIPRQGAGLLSRRARETMPPKKNQQPAGKAEPNNRAAPKNQPAAQEASNTPATANTTTTTTNPPLPPTSTFNPPLPPTTTTTTTSRRRRTRNPATPSAPAAHAPQPRNNAPPLPPQSAQTLQRWHNQTVNNFNKGATRVDRFVWLPTSARGGFLNATPAGWERGDWDALVREREEAEEQQGEEQDEDEDEDEE